MDLDAYSLSATADDDGIDLVCHACREYIHVPVESTLTEVIELARQHELAQHPV